MSPQPSLLAQECTLESSDATNQAAYSIQRAREAEGSDAQRPHYRSALEVLQQSSLDTPNDLATLWLLGEAYIGLGNFAAADSALNRLVEIQPGCEQRATQTRRQGWVMAYNRGVQSFSAGD